MKKYFKLIILFLIILSSCVGQDHRTKKDKDKINTTYINPIFDHVGPADPDVFFFNGLYYLSCTGDTQSYDIYTSTDLINWTKGNKIYTSDIGNVWAPDFWYCEADGYFYLYTSENFSLYVACSAIPDGIYEKQNLLVTNSIDAHLFEDDDGQLYLYYTKKAEEIWCRKMKSPAEFASDPEVFIMTDDHDWENPRNEGPFMIKRDNIYYLIYSGNNADSPDYAVGYATSNNPLGPFTKYEHNPIAKRDDSINLYGPGHGSAIQDQEGNYWYVYHQQMDKGYNWNRKICIDPLIFDEQGVLSCRVTKGTEEEGPVVYKE